MKVRIELDMFELNLIATALELSYISYGYGKEKSELLKKINDQMAELEEYEQLKGE